MDAGSSSGINSDGRSRSQRQNCSFIDDYAAMLGVLFFCPKLIR
jgi:hypothetical protein